MMHFLTAAGIVDITMPIEELYLLMLHKEKPTASVWANLHHFEALAKEPNVLFLDRYNCSADELSDLLGSNMYLHRDLEVAIEAMRKNANSVGYYSIVTALMEVNRITCYLREPMNRSSLDILYRKKIIDDMIASI